MEPALKRSRKLGIGGGDDGLFVRDVDAFLVE
jgi:hypothetical protein